MLGFENQHTTLVKEPYASEIRKKLERYATKNFNEEDLKQIERQKKILQKYNSIWINNDRDKN